MNIKYRLFTIVLISLLSGCGEDVKVGEIPIPESKIGTEVEFQSKKSYIENVKVKFQTNTEVNETNLTFGEQGIIRGFSGPMIPLTNNKSDLSKLGFNSYLSLDGTEAKLTYNDSEIRFTRGYAFMFVNDKSYNLADDRPATNNSTLYVPLVPMLDALNINYRIESSDLIIGEMYVDEHSQN